MRTSIYFLTLLVLLTLVSCSHKEKIYIVANEEILIDLAKELTHHLSKTYPDKVFELSEEKIQEKRNILLEITDNVELLNNEAYIIDGEKDMLFIRGRTPRALVNGVNGLLKYLGWNFYLSFEVPPVEPKPLDFSTIKTGNAPLKGKRIIFNWHNFLSGCTGWDYEQWEQWIDNSRKIGFNTIMVHAYGNNPMQSFSLNGVGKTLGYLTTTQKGRDWGTQHVNDVRLLFGGGIFKDYEFGSEAAKVSEEERSSAATELMQKVFKHAERKKMDICFAIDVDTWMANPQNIINTLPDESLIQIDGYNTVNPEHPEGRRYYEAQIKKLFADYPEINILAAWMRMPEKNPRIGSIWLKHYSNTLPDKWQKEYFEILKKHPELKDERPYPGLFAISKIIEVYREILDDINPEIELVLGSWLLDYPKQSDPFIPEYCGFIPLDWSYVFDQPEVIEELSELGKHRNLYPIVWAHHDDHRYIGRPYKPFSDFNTLLDQSNSVGYGIIHWKTHPLDMIFNNYENQVWQNTINESLEEASDNYARTMLKAEDNKLFEYFRRWFSSAPMFGRETSDFFLVSSEDYTLEGYNSSLEVVEKAEERMKLLGEVDTNALNEQGLKEYGYQMGTEKFIISFFNNHHNNHQAYKLLQDGRLEDALPFISKLNPEETLDLYAEKIANYGATRGEEGILVSLNLRWLPDYIDLRQRAGLEPVFINFQPTSHDPLAQGAGTNTFFIDEDKKFWLSLGEKELGTKAYTNGTLPLQEVTDSWIEFSDAFLFPVKTMRKNRIETPVSELKILFAPQSAGCNIEIIRDGRIISSYSMEESIQEKILKLSNVSGEFSVKIIPVKGNVRLAGIIVGSFF